jgi:hypothetical protein
MGAQMIKEIIRFASLTLCYLPMGTGFLLALDSFISKDKPVGFNGVIVEYSIGVFIFIVFLCIIREISVSKVKLSTEN